MAEKRGGNSNRVTNNGSSFSFLHAQVSMRLIYRGYRTAISSASVNSKWTCDTHPRPNDPREDVTNDSTKHGQRDPRERWYS